MKQNTSTIGSNGPVSNRDLALLNSVPEIIMLVDSSMVYSWGNKTGIEFFGKEAIGTAAANYSVGDHDTAKEIKPLFDGDDRIIDIETWQRREDGENRLIAWRCRSYKDGDKSLSRVMLTGRDISDCYQSRNRIEHLNSLLLTIRKINQLIVMETDISSLLKGVCESLIESRSYLGCSIALVDKKTGYLSPHSNAGRHGFNDGWSVNADGDGMAPECIMNAIKTGSFHVVNNSQDCNRCEYCGDHGDIDHSTFIAPLKIKEDLAGLLIVAMEKEMMMPSEEKDLIVEIANDIALGINKLRTESRLQTSEFRYETLIQSINSGVAVYKVINDGLTGDDYIIQSFNKRSLEIEGKKLEDVVGKSLKELRPNIEDYGLITVFNEVWKTGNPALYPAKIYVDENYSNYYENRIYKLQNDEIVAIYDDVSVRENANERIRESQERFDLAMTASKDGIFDWNLITNDIYYSPGWKRMLGYKEDELPNDFSVWEKLTRSEDAQRAWKMQNELINRERDSFEIEFQMKHKGGHWVDILSRAEAVFDRSGKAVRIVGTHVNITDRKNTEEELISTNQKLETSNKRLESSGSELREHATDLNERIKEITCLYGVIESIRVQSTPEETFGDITKLIPQGWHHPEITRCKVIFKGKEYVSEPFEETHWKMSTDIVVNGKSSGSIEVYYLEERPIRDEGPFVTEERKLLDHMARNLSESLERKEAEDELLASYQHIEATNLELKRSEIEMGKLAKLVSENPYPVLRISHDGTLIFGNSSGLKFMKQLGCQINECLPDDIKENTDKALSSNQIVIDEITVKNKNYSMTFVPIKDMMYVNIYCLDITQLKLTEVRLKANLLNLSQAEKVGQFGSWTLDKKTSLVSWSNGMYEIFGVDDNKTDERLEIGYNQIHPEDRERAVNESQNAINKGIPFIISYRITMAGGSIKHVINIGNPIVNSQGKVTSYIGIIQDIANRIKSESLVRESERKYRKLFENAPVMIHSIDYIGNISSVNKRWLEKLGYSEDEVLGKKSLEFLTNESRERAMKIFMPELEKRGYVQNVPFKFLRKDGNVIDVLLTAFSEKDHQGEISRSIGVLVDVSDEKRSKDKIIKETKRAEFYLDLLSHDIGNIHQGILNWLELAQMEPQQNSKIEKSITQSEILTRRSMNLIKNVKIISQLKTRFIMTSPLNISETIRNTINTSTNLFAEKDIEICLEETTNDIWILAEPIIESLFINLFHNAIKSQIRQDSRIDITTSIIDRGLICKIEIADYGSGINDEMKKMVLNREKYSELKRHTGLGLQIVNLIVDRFNGSIQLENRVKDDYSKGVKFIIEFPIESLSF